MRRGSQTRAQNPDAKFFHAPPDSRDFLCRKRLIDGKL
jgi:hypothetical protein